MIIIIDGYNLLRNIFHKEKGRLDKQRDELIRQLSYYKRKKKHEIVVVFDGGLLNHATREIKKGVVVVFSGRGESADDWIFEYVERNKNKELLLITHDKQLIDRCMEFGADALGVKDFYVLLKESLLEDVEKEVSKKDDGDSSIQKYKRDKEGAGGEIDSEALDLLMAQTDLSEYKKDGDEDLSKVRRKKQKSKTFPKKAKKIYKKIKKL